MENLWCSLALVGINDKKGLTKNTQPEKGLAGQLDSPRLKTHQTP